METIDSLQSIWFIAILILCIVVSVVATIILVFSSSGISMDYMIEDDIIKFKRLAGIFVIGLIGLVCVIATRPKTESYQSNIIDYNYNELVTKGTMIESENTVYDSENRTYTIKNLGYADYPNLKDGFYYNLQYEHTVVTKFGILPFRKEFKEIEFVNNVYVTHTQGKKIEVTEQGEEQRPW